MTTTPNIGLNIIDFDDTPWHDDVNQNFELLDAIINASTGVAGLEGAWINSLSVSVGEKWVDTDTSTVWQAAVSHTTAASGTFEDDRNANPTYWTPVLGSLNARGEWQSGIVYAAGDTAYTEAEALYCVCAITHVSTTSQRADIANWIILADGSSVGDTAAVRYVAQTLTAPQKAQAKSNLSIQSYPLVTRYTTAGGPFTHTFDTACVKFRIIGGGAGAGGGGVPATATQQAGSGGGSGYVGESDFITKGAITSATINIGAKGNGGVGASTGSNGGNTTYTDGTNSFTFGGGQGGPTNNPVAASPSPATSVGTLYGSAEVGSPGSAQDTTNTVSGKGGSNRYGTGGRSVQGAAAGQNASGLSAGGSGAARGTSASAALNGGNGADGFIFVEEYF